MKKFRSILVLLLAIIMIFSFAGCGSKDSSGGNDAAPSEQSQEADNSSSVTPAQPSDQSGTSSGESSSSADQSTGSQDQQSSDPESSSADKPTPPDRGTTDSSSSSEQPIAEVPDELKGDYTGDFVSNTGTGLNLITKWGASKNSGGDYDVTFQFYLSTYSLQVSDRSGNKLEVKTPSGTRSYSFSTKAVDKKENKLESVFIGQTTIQMTEEELSAGADVKATWDFRGAYSDKSLPEITAEGKVTSK